MNQAVADLLECPNCGTPLVRHYCPECGQKVGPVNPTLHDFLHDLTHELLHVDSKIFRSVRLLLTRPGVLTREYFAGRKARYISPLRLYLIFSVAYFAASALTSTPVFRPDEEIEWVRSAGYSAFRTPHRRKPTAPLPRRRHIGDLD